ncbi:conserved hypothetical protein [Ricinus communis]|uniref:Uncharacterized protein n=1 Tax=Ricinus communis TaxID=3988 RepID=B9TGK0_RICCO|nr:conserved hypothetical protein [Ricinus communis]
MQPMGRKPVRFPCKQDCHPRKPLVNWWEVEIATEGKKTDRQRGRRAIAAELQGIGRDDVD